ncbi:RNA polymerase sigma factor [Flexithrix dorotheae]|uniref:RNA polymerase sigma factor n=1 Tax=Flexithrix dorotheae TaxID=70993 RepID=UPI000366167C|nr:sigma-70 family RNA polymerase sigma factor [Flexithrix dorotheae]
MKIGQKSFIPSPAKKAVPKTVQFDQQGFPGKSDPEIWLLFKNGDDDALCHIYNTYVEKLFIFGHQITRDKDRIKDKIQDLFIHLKMKRKSLGEVVSIKAYLYKSLWRMLLEKSKKNDFVIYDGNQNLNAGGFSIKINAEVELIEGETYQERLQFLTKELNKLSKKQRQAIVHYYYEGFSHEEIAYIMGLKNKDSARKLIYRGIESLKEKISAIKYLLFPLILLMLIG